MRAEYLRRQIEQDAHRGRVEVTCDDFDRFRRLSADLEDPDLMDAAWS